MLNKKTACTNKLSEIHKKYADMPQTYTHTLTHTHIYIHTHMHTHIHTQEHAHALTKWTFKNTHNFI